MNPDLIAALIFIFLICIFLWRKRAHVQIQKLIFPILYFVMYKSKLGLSTMNALASRFRKFSKVFGWLGVAAGFIGMVFICHFLISNTILLFTRPEAAPGVQPVLPFEMKGVFFVPFLYWIISIFIVAAVHEFCHGWVARAHNIPLKSSGFAFLSLIFPIIPAAFVEPDERKLNKRPKNQQLSVFAAGPFSNIIFAALMFLLFMFVVSPGLAAIFEHSGITIVSVAEASPAAIAGIEPGTQIIGVNKIPVSTVSNFTDVLNQAKPGELFVLQTTEDLIPVELGASPQNSSQAWLGIYAKQSVQVKQSFAERYGVSFAGFLRWLGGLVYWLLLLSLGIGLFNLLPIGPLDGGRMLQQVLFKIFKKKRRAVHVWALISLFFTVLVFANLIAGFIK